MIKNLTANVGDIRDSSSIPVLGRSPGGGCDDPLQYSCLENPMDREDWRATVCCYRVGHDWNDLAHAHIPLGGYVFRQIRGVQRKPLIAFAVWQVPTAQNNQFTKVAYFWAAGPEFQSTMYLCNCSNFCPIYIQQVKIINSFKLIMGKMYKRDIS